MLGDKPETWTQAHPRRTRVLPTTITLNTITNHHHFATNGEQIAQLGALVTTRREGSPLVDATRHTIVAALTPAAAAALLRTLDGATVPEEVARVVTGLRDAAVHALAEA